MNWELSALKILAKNNKSVPGLALLDACKEIERLSDIEARLEYVVGENKIIKLCLKSIQESLSEDLSGNADEPFDKELAMQYIREVLA